MESYDISYKSMLDNFGVIEEESSTFGYKIDIGGHRHGGWGGGGKISPGQNSSDLGMSRLNNTVKR